MLSGFRKLEREQLAEVAMFVMPTRRFRAVGSILEVFAFANRTSGKELLSTRIHAFDTVCTVATVIDFHPDVTVVAIEIEIAFLFTTHAFAATKHFLIVVVTFCMNSIIAIAPRFRKLTANHS